MRIALASDLHLEFGDIELKNTEGAIFGDSDLCPLKHSFSDGIYF